MMSETKRLSPWVGTIPANIWTHEPRSLSTPGDYKADVSALALEATDLKNKAGQATETEVYERIPK